MTAHELSADLKNTAREKLAGKYGNAVVIFLLFFAIQFIGLQAITFPVAFVSAFISVLAGSSQMGIGYYIVLYLLETAFSIFANMLNTGLALFFLNMACGRTALVSDLVYGYRYLFKKSFAISAILVGLRTLVMLPYDICYFMYATSTDASPKWAYYMVITMIFGSIASLIITLFFSQVYYLLLDFPKHDVKQLFATSVRIMKGRKLKYLYLDFSFLPLELLSILTFGIGALWVSPYRMQTMALFFLDVMKSGRTETNPL